MEEFRTLERFPRYRFFADGTIRCFHRGEWRLKFVDTSRRYLSVRIGLSRKWLRLHLLIAEAFYGPKPEGMFCRHLDDNRFNNSIVNLAYGTRRQNHEDALRNGVLKSLLTEDQAATIVSMLSSHSDVKLGKLFNVDHATIRSIRRCESWGSIPRDIAQPPEC